MLGERKLWKWCLCPASQCEQVQGNCNKCEHKKQALERKIEKKRKIRK
ncbi:MAG TPA: hypothetical protein VFD40_01635 [Candidatus Paceibacterota bacterium]|nr:hypothetical protein [Candidatus Paceibacterota bacterium]